MSSAFQRDTAVTIDPASPGRFLAHLPRTWAAPNVPWGGLSLATATRAMAEALPAAMPLRSVSCVFAAPVDCGDAEIDVTVLRAGRSVAQASATMRTPGRPAGLTAIAEPPSLVADGIVAALAAGEFHVFPDTMAKKFWAAYEGFARAIVEPEGKEG